MRDSRVVLPMIDVTHEPWTLGPPHAVRAPLMYQRWCDIAFLHWPYDPAIIAGVLPRGLDVETFEGRGWVSVTPFRLEDVRGPVGPALPWLSSSPETNVRTYVRDRRGRSGVWFFSLDVARAPMAAVARVAYRLPYMWSRLTVTRRDGTIRYVGRRRIGRAPATYDIEIAPGGALARADVTALDRFLTERYALLARYGRSLVRTRVDHPPWPLQRAEAKHVNESLVRACGIPQPSDPPLVHWSSGVSVRIAAPELR